MSHAPTYFEYWADCDTKERCAKHYAARFGGIPMRLSLSMVTTPKMNDGRVYVLSSKSSWQYPRNYPL